MNRYIYRYKIVGEENNNLKFRNQLLKKPDVKKGLRKGVQEWYETKLEREEDAWRRERARGIEEFWYMVDGVTLTMGVAGSKLEKALGDHFPEGERYFGLENFGNTCYCNSVLQVAWFFSIMFQLCGFSFFLIMFELWVFAFPFSWVIFSKRGFLCLRLIAHEGEISIVWLQILIFFAFPKVDYLIIFASFDRVLCWSY